MTAPAEGDFTRSGLDMPEGSANADQVEETTLVDTNADDHRNEVGEDAPPPEGGEGEGGDGSGEGEGGVIE